MREGEGSALLSSIPARRASLHRDVYSNPRRVRY